VDVLRQAAIDGLGIAFLGLSLVCEDLRVGRLRQILPEFVSNESVIVALVSYPDLVPPRAAVLVEYLREYFGDVPPWERIEAGC
jgi:DNA-binding transcriptional LysR family regulator